MTTEQIMKVCVGPLGKTIVKDDLREVRSLYENGTLIIGFGPTMGNIQDWLRNLEITSINFSHAYRDADGWGTSSIIGHEGFIIEYVQSSEAIRVAIEDAQGLGLSRLIFCGFSQGGAHAQIACYEWSKRLYGVQVDSITFGSPKVFTSRGKKLFDLWRKNTKGRSVNVILSNDTVTTLPWWILGYREVGERMVIGDKKRWIFGKLSVHTDASYLAASQNLDLKEILP